MSSPNDKALNPSLVSQIVVTNASTDGIVQIGTYDLSGSSYTDGSYTLVSGDLDKSGVKYEITIKDGVTSIGDYAFYGCTSLTSVIIPNSVTSIGDYTFYGCTSLTSVIIPNSVTSIRSYAFYSCTSLTSYNYVLSNGSTKTVTLENPDFSDMTIIFGGFSYTFTEGNTDLIIPNSATSIGYYAFNGCTSLTSVTIPDSVTSIGNRAFNGCTSLTSVTIPDSVTSIGDLAFEDTSLTSYNYVLSDGSTKTVTLENPDFSDMTIIFGGFLYTFTEGNTDLIIPNSVISIGDNAFDNCTSLTSVTIPDSVTSIGNDAFNGCTSLTEVTIPNSVISIGDNAFDSCTGLMSVIIGNSVTSIGDGAFYGCTGLMSVIIGNSVTSIGDGAFYNTSLTSYDYVLSNGSTKTVTLENPDFSDMTIIFGGFLYTFTEGNTNLTIPNSVTSIGYGAFYNTSLTSYDYVLSNGSTKTVTLENPDFSDMTIIFGGFLYTFTEGNTELIIPDSVTSIGDGAFYGCTGLMSVTIPDSVTSIGGTMFAFCTNLTSVTIPNSVTSIGYGAFAVTNLTSITFNFPDPGTENHTQIDNVSKLPTVNGNNEPITYDDYVFYDVPTQEATYVEKISGCTNTLAANYNSSATIDDGSCFVLEYDSTIGRLRIEYRRK